MSQSLNPSIDFKHVLSELSVNRTDPCEVIRELISNSYDANAKYIRYSPIIEQDGFIFYDNGIGLDLEKSEKGISSYEAFFSIGRSTKTKGTSIGYKCQGSKLCFAASRFLVITKTKKSNWIYKIIENPRENLTPSFNIYPSTTTKPSEILYSFINNNGINTLEILKKYDFDFFEKNNVSGTLIVLLKFDTENFSKHFYVNGKASESYLYNYIRCNTKHGDVTAITAAQGYKASAIKAVNTKKIAPLFEIITHTDSYETPYGFPYLIKPNEAELDIKNPSEVARLQDGRFYDRYAKKISFEGKNYSFILAIDGNRRAHEKYANFDRKGSTKSGMRLVDQRGCYIASSGIKIGNFTNNLFSNEMLQEYRILSSSEAIIHYTFIIDGSFDLVTNRNSPSRDSFKTLENQSFLNEVKKFLDESILNNTNKTFEQLLSRLKREHTDDRRDSQINQAKFALQSMAKRERFRIIPDDQNLNQKCIFVSPKPGEEYMVGVLYATLGRMLPKNTHLEKYWNRVISFSTHGIDSIAMIDSFGNLSIDNLLTVEYKYSFNSKGPFNHALITVDSIVSWEVDLGKEPKISDDYGCFGFVSEIAEGIWEINSIEDEKGTVYDSNKITVICLKTLIQSTFPEVTYRTN